MTDVKPISGISYSTGGGCVCAEGKTNDGYYFMVDFESGDVTIVNDNPTGNEDAWTADWMECHLIGYFIRGSEMANKFIEETRNVTEVIC